MDEGVDLLKKQINFKRKSSSNTAMTNPLPTQKCKGSVNDYDNYNNHNHYNNFFLL